MRKGCMLIVKEIWSKYSKWRSFSESKPVLCTNRFRKNNCPYWLVVWAISLNFLLCFLLVPLSYTPQQGCIRRAIVPNLYNFVKQNKSSLLSPLRKRRSPQHIKHIRNTRVSCSFRLNLLIVVRLVRVPNSVAILHKR